MKISRMFNILKTYCNYPEEEVVGEGEREIEEMEENMAFSCSHSLLSEETMEKRVTLNSTRAMAP